MDTCKLHAQAYGELVAYYNELTIPMRPVRSIILRALLEQQDPAVAVHAFGCVGINETLPLKIDKTHSILDLGCANGDNLKVLQSMGYTRLEGIDIAPDMVAAARTRTGLPIHCADIMALQLQPVDVIFAQAFVHLFPKSTLPKLLLKLCQSARRRVYFSTTLHDLPSEGLEIKKHIKRYRSRYTQSEIFEALTQVLATLNQDKVSWRVFYFYLHDPLDKHWINVIIDRADGMQRYQEEGVVLWRHWFGVSQVGCLRDSITQLSRQEAAPQTWLRYQAGKWQDRIENFLPFLPALHHQWLQEARLFRTVSQFMQTPVSLLKDKCNFKPPGKPECPVHQDASAGWERRGYGKHHLSVAFALSEIKANNGPLHFAVRAHQQGLLGRMCEPVTPEQAGAMAFTPVLMQPGDAVFFDSYAPHFSPQNTADVARPLVFLTFVEGLRPRLAQQFFQEKAGRQMNIDDACHQDTELTPDALHAASLPV